MQVSDYQVHFMGKLAKQKYVLEMLSAALRNSNPITYHILPLNLSSDGFFSVRCGGRG